MAGDSGWLQGVAASDPSQPDSVASASLQGSWWCHTRGDAGRGSGSHRCPCPLPGAAGHGPPGQRQGLRDVRSRAQAVRISAASAHVRAL